MLPTLYFVLIYTFRCVFPYIVLSCILLYFLSVFRCSSRLTMCITNYYRGKLQWIIQSIILLLQFVRLGHNLDFRRKNLLKSWIYTHAPYLILKQGVATPNLKSCIPWLHIWKYQLIKSLIRHTKTKLQTSKSSQWNFPIAAKMKPKNFFLQFGIY